MRKESGHSQFHDLFRIGFSWVELGKEILWIITRN
jgi:hypothetical protein